MSFVGFVHHCRLPEANLMDWQHEILWKCDHCEQLWQATIDNEWYGFMHMRLRTVYGWIEYDGPVE